ncbi:Pou domain-N-terminal to homeobox domain-containing protein [Alkalicoccus daliensis]|uniref:Pou domain-N-terminal to homeobox domain-containing protein n=2 Tax=Alkalicoccus daliensis TaxID=745820 RepID=A0A1H0D2Y5_9BACI|nr:Pou domain-N-terminal to homeobox domain-containing protein [Alkalicoccus daliensis]
MTRKNFDDVMQMLKQVPGTEKHLNSFSVLMGKKILKRRIELGLTQQELIVEIRKNGSNITQSTLSKVESGDANATSDTYNKIFYALGELSVITPEYRDKPEKVKN